MESEQYVSPLLAVSAISLVFVILGTLFVADLPVGAGVRALIERHVQKAMALVAGVAMAASLYYSEVVGFIPCEFCWYQRIAMYPLAILLIVAVVTRTRIPSRYIVPLAVIGLGLSLYHYQLQLFPEQGGACSAGVPCSGKNVNEFDFVTIPFMAGCGFFSILLLQVAEWRVQVLHNRWSRSTTPTDGLPQT